MSSNSKIEWTEITWNPVTGCNKISPGCLNCYAERMSKRLQSMGVEKYSKGFDITVHRNLLAEPYQWKKPKLVFVNSMSDLFHENIPNEFIYSLFNVMRDNKMHIFQILTKRSKRLVELDNGIIWPPNVWMGVSVENNDFSFRINHLQQTKAKTKFVSFEPLLGHISNIKLQDIDWVIVGGESGPHARFMDEGWVVDIRDHCLNKNIPFFFKQWGGKRKRMKGRILQGREWNEMPNIFK